MALLLDSGFLYATVDKGDTNHQRVQTVLLTLSPTDLILPTIVLVEVSYLLQKRHGHRAVRQFVKRIADSPILFEALTQTDLKRVYELLNIYADAKLDFVDVAITALAERLNIRQILTVDERDFRLIKPAHCAYFEILP
jgi:predicted nucleic acid-binding protein